MGITCRWISDRFSEACQIGFQNLSDRDRRQTILDEGDQGIHHRLRSKDAASRVLLTRALMNKDIRATGDILEDGDEFAGLRPAMEAQRIRTCRYQIRRVLYRIE